MKSLKVWLRHQSLNFENIVDKKFLTAIGGNFFVQEYRI